MQNHLPTHSSTWVNFIYGSFFISVLMSAIGIFFMPVDLWARGYMAMGEIMIIMMSITLTKTIRDNQESERYNDFHRGQN